MSIILKSLRKIPLNFALKKFYRYRYDQDYIRININKKKLSYINFKKKFLNINKINLSYLIIKNNNEVGFISYNKSNFYYFIILNKKFRNKGYGTSAIKKLITIIKKRNLKLRTLVHRTNLNSIKIHNKICLNRKKYDKNFYLYIIV